MIIFTNKYYFLSNNYQERIFFEGLIYRNAEAAFQASKTKDPITRFRFTKMTSLDAKTAGEKLVPYPHWHREKDSIMRKICGTKFLTPILQKWLLETEDEELVNVSLTNDTYWGVNTDYIGENKLGKILMEIREQLQQRG